MVASADTASAIECDALVIGAGPVGATCLCPACLAHALATQVKQ